MFLGCRILLKLCFSISSRYSQGLGILLGGGEFWNEYPVGWQVINHLQKKPKEWTKQAQKLYGGNPSIISSQVTAQMLTGQYIYYLIINCSKSVQSLIDALLSSPSRWPQCLLGACVYKTTYCAQKGNSEVSVWNLPEILTATVKICGVRGWWSEACQNITLSHAR